MINPEKHGEKDSRTEAVRRAIQFLLTIIGTMVAIKLIFVLGGYRAAQNEYSLLREYSPSAEISLAPFQTDPETTGSGTETAPQSVQAETAPPIQPSAAVLSAEDLSKINPDYIGWIRISGTPVDYPIVQGRDNIQYVNTTFTGEQNRAGAIFMDYKCDARFDSPLVILYGHNMKDGSMFASLQHYRDKDFLAERSDITINTPAGELLIYRIFLIKMSDIYDEVFTLRGKSGQDVDAYCATLDTLCVTGRVLVLSTCTNGGNKDERLLLFACAA